MPPTNPISSTDALPGGAAAGHWRRLVDASGVALVILDGQDRVIDVTASATDFDFQLGEGLSAWWSREVADGWQAALVDLRQPGPGVSVEIGLRGGRSVRLSSHPGRAQDAALTVLVVTDRTDARDQAHALVEAQARLDETEQVAHVGSFIWQPASGAAHWSDEMLRVFGYEPDASPWVRGGNAAEAFSARIHPEDRDAVLADWRQAAEGKAAVTSYRIVRPGGEVRWLVGRTRPVFEGERLVRVVGTVQDVTEEHTAAEVLEHLALHDALTGLPNRVLFMDRLSHALDRRTRGKARVAVLFCDVDHFKWVNDSLGHDAGDRLLVELARRLAAVVRPGDTVGRLGGDEFAVLCEDLTSDVGAAGLAERVRTALALPFDVGGAELVPTVSIGLAVAWPESSRDPDSIMREADAAMYRAKERGRDRVEAFDEAMRVRALLRVRTETELRRGMDRDELVTWFQPHVHLDTGRIAGAEALARWQHPTRGIVLPADFVPVAEETGLILTLGRSVLDQALTEATSWPASGQGELTVSVNLSARQLLSPELLRVVGAALDRSGIDPSRLCLEITESVLLSDAEQSSLQVEGLRNLGVHIAVDDFGTGYSSLTYLRRFPLDVLKIDRSFVAGIANDRADRSIVAATITLARDLGLVTVAEGVETEDQARDLAALGCQFAQGNYWSEALPPEAFRQSISGASR